MSLRLITRVLPNVLVFAALAGLAWWGHSTRWKLPKYAEVAGAGPKPKEDWCEAHAVPESICVECREDLLPRARSFGWCDGHGVHECPLCHPEVAQLAKPYAVTSEDREQARRALAFDRPANSKKCQLHKRRIQFASAGDFKKAGVGVDVVSRAEDFKTAVRETIPVYGEVVYDPGRVAHLASRAAGSVAKVYKHLGDPVQEGDVLALVDAAEVGRAKAEFQQSALAVDVRRKDRARLGTSNPEAMVAAADAALREAKLRLQAARQALINLGLPRTAADFETLAPEAAAALPEEALAERLHFLGIPEALRKELDPRTQSSNLLPLRAPIGGAVVSRDVVAGEVVDSARTLFEVVDTSRVWLQLDVRPEDVAKVTPGKSRVFFKPDGLGREVEGTVAAVRPDADPRTRTVRARAELDNADGRLRANTFGAGRIVLREEPGAVVVPNGAVHWEGDCHVVFVRDKDWFKEGAYKVFHTRVVRVGARDEKLTEIIAGVLPGEVVATTGSEVLRAELLKDNLGEG